MDRKSISRSARHSMARVQDQMTAKFPRLQFVLLRQRLHVYARGGLKPFVTFSKEDDGFNLDNQQFATLSAALAHADLLLRRKQL